MLMRVPDHRALVLDKIPIPQLHVMMGCTNHIYNILRKHMIKVQDLQFLVLPYLFQQLGRLQKFDKWCQKNGISRRGRLSLASEYVTNRAALGSKLY